MNTARRLFLFLALVASISALATTHVAAQVPLAGSHEIVFQDGSPINPNIQFGNDISITPSGQILSEAWIDRGAGRVRNPREDAILEMLDVDGTVYLWNNAAGTTGLIYWSDDRSQWESLVLTGPNKDRITAYRPL